MKSLKGVIKMNVQDVEKQLNITRANIRFYEREGLISPSRKENGYRDYTDEDIIKLKKIVIFRKLGFSVSDIKDILNGTLPLQDAIKNNIENLEKNLEDLTGAIDLCNEIISENIEEKSFSEDYFWNLLNSKEKDGQKFKSIYGDYLKKHYTSNIILTFIICIAPLLNIIFDYCFMNKTPNIKSVFLAIVCLCVPISYIAFTNRIAEKF